MELKPAGDSLIVEPIDEGSNVGDGVVQLGSTNEQAKKGKVVAVGEGKVDTDGKRIPLEVKKNDEVLFSKYAGSPITVDGEDLLVLRESDVLERKHPDDRGQRKTEIARRDSESSERLTELDREIQTNIAQVRELVK
jgi:chaperonin GroES